VITALKTSSWALAASSHELPARAGEIFVASSYTKLNLSATNIFHFSSAQSVYYFCLSCLFSQSNSYFVLLKIVTFCVTAALHCVYASDCDIAALFASYLRTRFEVDC